MKNRRDFLKLGALAALGASIPGCRKADKPQLEAFTGPLDPVARVPLPRLGRPLPQAVDLGQSRPLHAFGELHGLLQLERLRAQRRDDSRRAGRRLPAHQRGSSRLQPARLPERRLLHRIRLWTAAAALAADPRGRARRRQVAQGDLGRSSDHGRRQTARQHLSVRARHQHVLQRDPGHEPGIFAAGSRFAQYTGGVFCSFYDWYCDLPPGEPLTWGVQTESCECADWFNSKYIVLWGSNISQTRIPDAHFA